MPTHRAAWLTSLPILAALLWPSLALAQQPVTPTKAAESTWPVVGRQGVMRFVVVPLAQARDREAYVQQIKQLCEPLETCFLNFYTNSTGAELSMPLPDAVTREATAVFRRSLKQGAEGFRWSCRMGSDEGNCF